MKQNRRPKGFRPFADLKSLLQSPTPAPAVTTESSPPSATRPDPESCPNPLQLDPDFFVAVADITPINSNKVITPPNPPAPLVPDLEAEKNCHATLEKMILEGDGFAINNIPEYLEGTGYNIDPKITNRLHRGDFSIQDHIDLHGLNRQDAKDAFDAFLNEALRTGKRMVLIIHGRGLSSPCKPVLKSKVSEWLSSGIWRKWILAFSSARAIDGGAGATYVLLRKNPATKRQRKGKKIRIHQEFSAP